MAMEICRSVEYYLTTEGNWDGGFFLILPLRMAYQALELGTPVSLWVRVVLNRIGECYEFESGMKIAGGDFNAQGAIVENEMKARR